MLTFVTALLKASRSWIGGWFKREATASPGIGGGPIRAKLGEETSFVFDPELKRWVNKKVRTSACCVLKCPLTDGLQAGGDASAAPTPAPPPPRAATVSPSKGSRPGDFSPSSSAPPRSSSAQPPPRPSSGAGGPPRTGSAASSRGPPPPAPSSGAATGGKRKPIKARYVAIS